VHYYVRDEATAILSLSADREPELRTVPVGAPALRALLATPSSGPGGAGLSPAAQQALAPLVEPVVDWAGPDDVVYLCPHDALHRLPLHAVDCGGLPLGVRNPVAYTPSTAVLRFALAKRRARRPTALVLGDPPGQRPLAFSRDQAIVLGDLLRQAGHAVRVRVGAQASLAGLLAELPTDRDAPNFVHFAVHGSFAPGAGMTSGLDLAGGRLTAERMLALPLDAELVTLGSCESGVSQLRTGDELIGLTRAVLYSGAGSVLVSLWQVDQLPTTLLMLAFYRALLAGAAKADALRAAQRSLRRTTARAALAYLGEAAGRLGDGGRVAVGLAATKVHLAAQDYPAALARSDDVLAEPALLPVQRRTANQLHNLGELGLSRRAAPDYDTLLYDDPQDWAAFVLIGDWR
jgi:CHAT domain-containing protein